VPELARDEVTKAMLMQATAASRSNRVNLLEFITLSPSVGAATTVEPKF